MALSKDDKDEIRELIAREVRDVVKGAANAVVNLPLQPGEGRHGMSAEATQQRDAEKKVAQRIAKTFLDAAEANYREAQARVVEKTDPVRANVIRRLIAEF